METFSANSSRHNTHFVGEGSSLDCMSQTALSQDLEDNAFLDSWYCREDSFPLLGSTSLLNPLGPIFVEDEPHRTPQHPHSFGSIDLYLPSPPLTGSTFKHPASLPPLCGPSFMDPDLPSRHHLSRLLTESHDACCRPQPPSPPLDTPELIQRTLLDSNHPEPLSPPLTSPVDIIDLPSLSSFDVAHEDALDLDQEPHYRSRDDNTRNGEPSSSKRRCCWSDFREGGAGMERHGHNELRPRISSAHELLTPDSPTWQSTSMLEPLFDDSTMDWSGGAGSEHDFNRNLRTPPEPTKQRGNSLDSSQQESYDFLSPMHSLRPRRRSFTTPPDFSTSQPSSSPRLDDLWDETTRMDIDDDVLTRSPRSPSLNLSLAGFDDPEMSLMDEEAPTGTYTSALLSASPQPPPPLALFDEPAYCGGLTEGLASECDFVPSSPHSPHMQLLPSEEDEAMFGVDSPEPTATIAPALLGLPGATDNGAGLGLDVDPGLDRSPSPSDYELQMLEGHMEVTAKDLPEDEFARLRGLYEELAGLEASLKEREGVLDRRVKDISALLKPERASPDAAVMRGRRQEYRVASELRAEARRARKEEKHRLRELGTLLDLKCRTRAFNTKSSMRSVAHLVADMVFKRHDRSRSLANRKTAAAPRSSSCSSSSPLRESCTDEDATFDDSM